MIDKIEAKAEYIIVEVDANDLGEMTRIVNAQVELGYFPSGGLVFFENSKGQDRAVQVMWRDRR